MQLQGRGLEMGWRYERYVWRIWQSRARVMTTINLLLRKYCRVLFVRGFFIPLVGKKRFKTTTFAEIITKYFKITKTLQRLMLDWNSVINQPIAKDMLQLFNNVVSFGIFFIPRILPRIERPKYKDQYRLMYDFYRRLCRFVIKTTVMYRAKFMWR